MRHKLTVYQHHREANNTPKAAQTATTDQSQPVGTAQGVEGDGVKSVQSDCGGLKATQPICTSPVRQGGYIEGLEEERDFGKVNPGTLGRIKHRPHDFFCIGARRVGATVGGVREGSSGAVSTDLP